MSADPVQAGSRARMSRPAGSDARLRVVATPGFADYALLDSGNGRKLERFGRFRSTARSRRRCGSQTLEPGVWLRADAAFKSSDGDEDGEGGRWRKNKPLPETWALRVLGVTVLGRLTSFRHLGLFPEQLPHWQWMLDRLAPLRARTAARAQPVRLHGRRLPDRGQRRRRGDPRRCLQAGDRLGQAEPGGLQARRGADPLDPGGCAQVRGPRGAARQELSRDPGRPAEVRARARRRGVGRVPASARRCCATARACWRRGRRHWCSPPTPSAPPRWRPMRWCASASPAGRGATESGELAVIEEAAGRLLPTSLYTRWTADDATP